MNLFRWIKRHIFSILIVAALLVLPAILMDDIAGNGSDHGKAQASSAGQSPKDQYFAKIPQLNIELAYPARFENVVAVGYHEANNNKAYSMVPKNAVIGNDPEAATVAKKVAASKGSKDRLMFVMNTRGRGQAPTSAADIAVKNGTAILSPVTGTVSKVKKYILYGKLEDYHVELTPDGAPSARVVMIHITTLKVAEGDRVTAGVTEIARPRFLQGIGSQIERYLPEPYLHVHIQVNPYANETSGNTPAG